MANNKLGNLRDHLFETIEMLKNNNDPDASENEKIDVEVAKTISDLSGKVIDSYKVEVQAMNVISKADNVKSLMEAFSNSGLVEKPKELSQNTGS